MSSGHPSDYAAIRADHERRYGTDIAEFGPRLFEEQYADPRHFLLELLQNAEDALARRATEPPVTERGVSFDLTADALRVSHFGDPFNPADVTSICGVGKSTKRLDSIGRFGLGFKSVYAFTDRPEIHSGPEDFAIDSYVWPEMAEPVNRKDHETVILLARKSGSDDWTSLRDGLPNMLSGPYLLFLRHIESVRWSAPDGSDAEYLRESRKISPGVRRVTLFGGADGGDPRCDEEWLIFDRFVRHDGRAAGRVEIAFAIDSTTRGRTEEFQIRRLTRSPLYAYFPTDKETHLGFHIQGPYNTTPARDNVLTLDRWNQGLVSETASLLRQALTWLRDREAISVDLLSCLPLDKGQFRETMFLPIFEEVSEVLREECLLPADSGGHVSASRAKLGRGRELRRMFAPNELAELCGAGGPTMWLSGEISQDRDRARTLYWYLRRDLEVQELTPESVVQRLTGDFLNRRSDEWILRFYEFLADQAGSSLRSALRQRPILRLDDGRHVRPPQGDDRGVFFPGEAATGFRTVSESVCQGDKARKLLESLGVRNPDLVHDVIENVLPRYDGDRLRRPAEDYEADLERIARAYETDSRHARSRLIEALKKTQWIWSVDGSGKDAGWKLPEELYLNTQVLHDLFDGLRSVWFPSRIALDESPLEREALLEACGVARFLSRTKTPLNHARRLALREGARATQSGGNDWTIECLDPVFAHLARDSEDSKLKRSKGLWSALRVACEASRQDGRAEFWEGEVHWSYSHDYRSKKFDAEFLKILRNTEWVADLNGVLRRPNGVVFSSLNWEDEPVLREKLGFLSDEDKRDQEQQEMLTALEEKWGIRTIGELHDRLADRGTHPTPEPPLAQTLAKVAEWWAGAKADERCRYRKEAYPSVLDVSSLGSTDRVGWFTLFALACFRSFGRTTDGQHRGFVDRGARDGWWEALAKSQPPEDVEAWLGRLQAWSGADQSAEDFAMWRGSFVSLYGVARWLDEYILLMRSLPEVVAESDGRVSLRDILNPTYSASVRKLGVDAAPLARTVGMGVNWMIRELIRGGIYDRGGPMVPYAWMPSQRVRRFFEPDLPEIQGNADESHQIHEFVVKQIGKEAADFDGDYDLPLQLWTIRGRM